MYLTGNGGRCFSLGELALQEQDQEEEEEYDPTRLWRTDKKAEPKLPNQRNLNKDFKPKDRRERTMEEARLHYLYLYPANPHLVKKMTIKPEEVTDADTQWFRSSPPSGGCPSKILAIKEQPSRACGTVLGSISKTTTCARRSQRRTLSIARPRSRSPTTSEKAEKLQRWKRSSSDCTSLSKKQRKKRRKG